MQLSKEKQLELKAEILKDKFHFIHKKLNIYNSLSHDKLNFITFIRIYKKLTKLNYFNIALIVL